MSALVSLVLAPACEFAYHVDPGTADAAGGAAGDAPPDGAGPFERCSFQGYGDPLRYATVSAASPGPLSWGDARAACIRRGMDLAVMNDADELGGVDVEVWPAWVGVSQATASSPWVAVDGCPAMAPAGGSVLGTAPGAGSACGAIATAEDLAASTCDGTIPSSPDGEVITRALCETPRPDSAACLRDPKTETYVASAAPLSYAAAVTYCQGQHAHLVVIDTKAELAYISALVPTVVTLDFWIGEKWDGTAWHAETACPGEFSWADGGTATASLASAESCTSAVLQNGPAGDPDNPATLGLRGQELVPCDAQKLALCERE